MICNNEKYTQHAERRGGGVPQVLKVLTWAPHYPDYNPIKHLWDALDKYVRPIEAPHHNL